MRVPVQCQECLRCSVSRVSLLECSALIEHSLFIIKHSLFSIRVHCSVSQLLKSWTLAPEIEWMRVCEKQRLNHQFFNSIVPALHRRQPQHPQAPDVSLHKLQKSASTLHSVLFRWTRGQIAGLCEKFLKLCEKLLKSLSYGRQALRYTYYS